MSGSKVTRREFVSTRQIRIQLETHLWETVNKLRGTETWVSIHKTMIKSWIAEKSSGHLIVSREKIITPQYKIGDKVIFNREKFAPTIKYWRGLGEEVGTIHSIEVMLGKNQRFEDSPVCYWTEKDDEVPEGSILQKVIQ